MKKIEFQNGNFYHIYNRGIDRRKVFLNRHDYSRFIVCLKEFNQVEPIGSLYLLNLNRKRDSLSGRTAQKNEQNIQDKNNKDNKESRKLVDIIAYALLPNHYHLLIKQLETNGTSEFIKRLAGGYTWYYNNKSERNGPLFAGKFKAIRIDSDAYLQQLSAYINANVEIHGISRAEEWIWSSYRYYINKEIHNVSNKNLILEDFMNIDQYKMIVSEVIKNAQQIKAAKYYLE